MSITKPYNNHTNTYYAYETEKKEQEMDVEALALRLSKIKEFLLILFKEIHSMR